MPRPGRLMATVLCALVLCGACRNPVPPVAGSATPAATSSQEASPTVTASVTVTLAPTATASATATLAPTATTVPSATCTPVPTRTPRPTIPPGPTPGCLAQVTPPPPAAASARPLRVVYWNDDRLWLWREEDGQAVALASNPKAASYDLSDDGRYIAFTRQAGDQPVEIWAVSTEGKGERRLAIPDAAELLARHPGVTPMLRYRWVPGTHLVSYCLAYLQDGYGPYYDTVWRVVDVDGGEPRVILPACGDEGVWFSPDGRYAVALIDTEVRVVDIAAGRVTHTIAFPRVNGGRTYSTEYVWFSPDGRRAALYAHGVAVLDLVDGTRRDIPLTFEAHGFGGTNMPFWAPLYWQADGNIVARVVKEVESGGGKPPRYNFTLWSLDVAQGTANKGQTFNGGPNARLSPDGRWVLFTGDDGYVLNIGDVQTGKSVAYEQPGEVEWLFWRSDSTHFFYALDDDRLMVGQICGPWVQVGLPARYALAYAGADPIPGRDDFLVESYASQSMRQIHLAGLDGTVRPVACSGDNQYIGCFLGD